MNDLAVIMVMSVGLGIGIVTGVNCLLTVDRLVSAWKERRESRRFDDGEPQVLFGDWIGEKSLAGKAGGDCNGRQD